MAASKFVSGALPRDLDNAPIQVLAPGTLVNAAIGGASARSALPSGAEIVEIAVNTDCWILFGGSTVAVSNSTGQFMPKGAVLYRVPADATHLAYIQDAAPGRISITRMV